jgi:hypothetical protein
MYVDGYKVATCNGGGYDMRSTCLGEYLQEYHMTEILELPNVSELYGIRAYKGKWTIDGGVGWESMRRILEALGKSIKYVGEAGNAQFFVITNKN